VEFDMNGLLKISAFSCLTALVFGLTFAFGLTDVTIGDYFTGVWAGLSASWPAFVGFVAGCLVMADRPSKLGWTITAGLYLIGMVVYATTFIDYVSWAWVGLGALGALIGSTVSLLVAYPYARRAGLI
jgi:hypothetical protein